MFWGLLAMSSMQHECSRIGRILLRWFEQMLARKWSGEAWEAKTPFGYSLWADDRPRTAAKEVVGILIEKSKLYNTSFYTCQVEINSSYWCRLPLLLLVFLLLKHPLVRLLHTVCHREVDAHF